MSISKTWVAVETNSTAVIKLYRHMSCPTVQQVAKDLQTTFHNVQWVLKHRLPPEEYKALQKVRYSRSKTAEKNPMHGKTGEQHHNWIGEVEDGYGYLTCLKDGKRQFVHRVMMAEALGLKELPECFDVHHIDTNTKHNVLDNFALVMKAGHVMIHYLQTKDSLSVELKKSSLWAAVKSMTSQ